MPGTIRLMVVDDSFFMRKLIRDLLSGESDIMIVGEAQNGAQAVKEAARLKPDVITMDYNMPLMNGAEAVKKILEGEMPLPAVVMLSAKTDEGTAETLECLSAGAVDFLAKPSGELSLNIEEVKAELIKKIRTAALAHVKQRLSQDVSDIDRSKRSDKMRHAHIVVIGASTGGPPVVEDILTQLPDGLPAAVLVVQHMPANFTKSLADRINRSSRIPVTEAQEGDVIVPGRCLIAPGGWHMVVETRAIDDRKERVVHLNKESPIFGLRPAIDITMHSVAEHYGKYAMGIILTGMGSDGTKGVRAIKENGGYSVAQDPSTCTIDSMPTSVIEAGLADELLSPKMIVERIVEMSG